MTRLNKDTLEILNRPDVRIAPRELLDTRPSGWQQAVDVRVRLVGVPEALQEAAAELADGELQLQRLNCPVGILGRLFGASTST